MQSEGGVTHGYMTLDEEVDHVINRIAALHLVSLCSDDNSDTASALSFLPWSVVGTCPSRIWIPSGSVRPISFNSTSDMGLHSLS